MPLLRIIAEGGTPRLIGSARALIPALRAGLRGSGPIVIMVHGYKFSPTLACHDPHGHIFSFAPTGDYRAVSWPRHLGFGGDVATEGLCLAFSWAARGRIGAIYDHAPIAGRALAVLIHQLGRIAPTRQVHVIAHSLGARVFLQALEHLPKGAVARAILLSGAEYIGSAQGALDTPAGETVEVLNITSHENDLYDCLFEWAVAQPKPGNRALGAGMAGRHRNWVDIQIDDRATLAVLQRCGFAIAPPMGRVCHWSSYSRAGVFELYQQALRAPESLPLTYLRHHLPQCRSRRWSRLFGWPAARMPLPPAVNPSS